MPTRALNGNHQRQHEPEALHMFLRGQARRDPSGQRALRFAAALRRQGFLPTGHFVQRFLQRMNNVRFDPRQFRSEFYRGQHYRQTRPGFNTRLTLVRGVPIVYRVSGEQGNRIVLITVWDGDLPPTAPVAAPAQRESESQPWELPYVQPINVNLWKDVTRLLNQRIDPIKRVRMLADYFNKLDFDQALILWDELKNSRQRGSLGALFHYRLATPSRVRLLNILFKKFA